MKEFTTSQRLRQLMNDRRLRQVDILRMAQPFCEKYGVRLGKNDLSQYVSGKVVPNQDKLAILGLALNVNEAWLMGYDVPQTKGLTTLENVTADEAAIISAYRSATPALQLAVRSILNV